MAGYDLFGIARDEYAERGKPADEIPVAQFLVKYRYKRNNAFHTRHRLTQVLRTVEWWDHIGYMLCFTATGTIEPDHILSSYYRKEQLTMVNRTLRLLDALEIPRQSYSGGRGFYSFYWPFYPCRYVATREGVCDRRPIIQQVIAVLSSQQEYTLGHVVAELACY
ncbi:hypothetical protein NQ176_g6127 [Zarea fungicola]|uniref:Uncharacterized protein n=1 Tax=Zarea fungicola TaxID=93591 RepID=A0ACC1N629_9HYPO|nr:hypothetical protein NQ176_g6127 [Lecanicillium fungicola]